MLTLNALKAAYKTYGQVISLSMVKEVLEDYRKLSDNEKEEFIFLFSLIPHGQSLSDEICRAILDAEKKQ